MNFETETCGARAFLALSILANMTGVWKWRCQDVDFSGGMGSDGLPEVSRSELGIGLLVC
jgi:hypothetical protein